MPFDVLPHHNIQMPQVQFWHPPWQMYQSLIESQRLRYAAMMKGLDSILDAVDPLNIAKRRQAIAEMQYEQQFGIPEKTAQAEAMLQWHREHPGQPWLTPEQQLAMNKLNQQESDAATYHDAFHPGGGGNQGIYKSGGASTGTGAGGLTTQQGTEAAWDRYKRLEESWLQNQPGSEQLWQTPQAPAMPSLSTEPPQTAPPAQGNVATADVYQPTYEEEAT